jgi:hypothetical protein
MAVFLSPVGGVAAQFFNNSGVILSGGKLYTYLAGTTTPSVTYTSATGATPHANPIILDSAGRVPGGEIWLANGNTYKFILKDSSDVLIATYDNVTGINDATSTNANLIAFENSLAASSGSSLVGYMPTGTLAVATTVQTKLNQRVSAFDFMTAAQIADVQSFDAVLDLTIPLQNFINACRNKQGFLPAGRYRITSALTIDPKYGCNISGECWNPNGTGGSTIYNSGTSSAIDILNVPYIQNYDSQIMLSNMNIFGNSTSQHGIHVIQCVVFLENMWISTNGFHGLFLEKAYGSSFKQVTFAQNYLHGCYVYQQNNSILFDHCVFNGNSRIDGYSGCSVSAITNYENLGVTFNVCDFSSNGYPGSVTTAFGLSIAYSYGISLIGCYFESNKLRNLYADSTCHGLSVFGAYFQDSTTELVSVDGLTYQNNQHQYQYKATSLSITNTTRGNYRISGNAFYNGATSTFVGCKQRAEMFLEVTPSTGAWSVGDIVWRNTVDNGYPIGYTCILAGTPGTWAAFGQVGNRVTSVTPVGAVTPIFVGEEILDTVAVKWYKSTGLTTASWVALN